MENLQKQSARQPEKKKMEALGRFSCKVAHDFNNLLGAIEGYATLAMNGVRADDPLRQDLLHNLKAARLPVLSIEELKAKADKIVGKPEAIHWEDKIVGVVKYRDGSVVDVIRQVKKEI